LLQVMSMRLSSLKHASNHPLQPRRPVIPDKARALTAIQESAVSMVDKEEAKYDVLG
jgi:hypothetical protein